MFKNALMLLGGVVVIFASGCGGAADMPSDAPSLAGSWLVQVGGGAGECWEFDTTGDPVRLTSEGGIGAGVIGVGDVSELRFDGSTQTLSLEGLSASVSAVGSATEDGNQVSVETTITISLGLVGGTATIDLAGTIDGGTWTGEMTTGASALGSTVPPTSSDFTATRDGC